MNLPININELLHGRTVEWDRIELKKDWNPESILHSLCAFANDINNLDGGYIIVGVEEQNGVAKLPPNGLMLEQIDAIQKKLIEISGKITPTYFPFSQPYLVDDMHILIIRVPGGDNRPYKVPVRINEKKTERAYYIRRGSVTKKVKDSSEEERRLLELTARIPFDDRLNHNSTIDDINLGLIRNYLSEIKSSLFEESTKIPFPDLCTQLQILKGTKEYRIPTNAGLLMFNEEPDKFIPGARIEIVIHKNFIGKDYEEKIFNGSIVSQIRNALSFLHVNVIKEFISKVPERAESIRYYNYPYRAIEEALVNAAFHKSYERENPVEVQVSPDKIEILSFPGPLPPIDNKALAKDRVLSRDYRNRKIGGFLKELKLSEGRATGIPIIRRELEKNGSPSPIFETDEVRSYFLSTIFIHPLANSANFQLDRRDDNIAMTKDTTKDTLLHINSLEDIDRYLWSYDDQRWAKEKAKIINKIDDLTLSVLELCLLPKSRDEIFKEIELYNNNRNFKNYIKPIIEVGWLKLTLPDKPTSKYQKYSTTEIAKRLIGSKVIQIKRFPVSSSSISFIGYDPQAKILEVEFHFGEIIRFFNVPQNNYDEFINSPSLSSYFMHNIKNKFKTQKM